MDLAQPQGGPQAIEGIVQVFDLDAQPPANLVHQGNVKAVDLAFGIGIELKGRIVGRCADDDFARCLDLLPQVA